MNVKQFILERMTNGELLTLISVDFLCFGVLIWLFYEAIKSHNQLLDKEPQFIITNRGQLGILVNGVPRIFSNGSAKQPPKTSYEKPYLRYRPVRPEDFDTEIISRNLDPDASTIGWKFFFPEQHGFMRIEEI